MSNRITTTQNRRTENRDVLRTFALSHRTSLSPFRLEPETAAVADFITSLILNK